VFEHPAQFSDCLVGPKQVAAVWQQECTHYAWINGCEEHGLGIKLRLNGCKVGHSILPHHGLDSSVLQPSPMPPSISFLDSNHIVCGNRYGCWVFAVPPLDAAGEDVHGFPLNDVSPVWSYAARCDPWAPRIIPQPMDSASRTSFVVCVSNVIRRFRQRDDVFGWTLDEEITLDEGGYTNGSFVDSLSGILSGILQPQFFVIQIPAVHQRGSTRLERSSFGSVSGVHMRSSAPELQRRRREKASHLSFDAESGVMAVLHITYAMGYQNRHDRFVLVQI
jgi:hypothetical protein